MQKPAEPVQEPAKAQQAPPPKADRVEVSESGKARLDAEEAAAKAKQRHEQEQAQSSVHLNQVSDEAANATMAQALG